MATESHIDIQTLQAEMTQLRKDFVGLNQTLRDVVRHGGSDAAAKVRETGDRVWGKALERAHSVGQEIGDRPLVSTAAALGIGIVILGVLLGSRHASSSRLSRPNP